MRHSSKRAEPSSQRTDMREPPDMSIMHGLHDAQPDAREPSNRRMVPPIGQPEQLLAPSESALSTVRARYTLPRAITATITTTPELRPLSLADIRSMAGSAESSVQRVSS